jgi:hypothetical protein
MSDLVPFLLVGAVAIQIPIGTAMYFDAKRLDLKDPEVYLLGVVLPAAGFVVILYYFAEWRFLPQNERAIRRTTPVNRYGDPDGLIRFIVSHYRWFAETLRRTTGNQLQ